ncbi:MAG: preprotein translocase subunit SecE [Clostridia bacterium]|nr:preprotein translocase subunit SecE [Clostridia bacterium]
MAKETEKKVTEKKSSKKTKKPNKIATWFKGFWSEIKRIVWPDGKTVFRNTIIVIVVVAIAAAVIYLFDQGMSLGLKGVKSLAGETTTTAAEDSSDAQTSEEALSEVATEAQPETKAETAE